MIYLRSFHFTNKEAKTHGMTCYNTIYPFGILEKHDITNIEFDNITIFYGGNGCGKTTALNVIAEKLKLERDTLYNKSDFFDEYLDKCDYSARRIPEASRIITSDDVFDYTMNLRYLNDGIDRQRAELFKDYEEVRFNPNYFSTNKIKSLDDYERFTNAVNSKRNTKSQYIKKSLMPNVREQSNGESGFMYFTSKIEGNALYLLDEPENSLSPERQQELLQFLQDSARFYNCQFIIATHSPFLLSLQDAKIYDFDENPVQIRAWTELKNVREYYNFFKLHEKEFEKPVITQTQAEPEVYEEYLGPEHEFVKKLKGKRRVVHDRLKAIFDDWDFLVGSMTYLDTEEKAQKMMDFLDETGTTDTDEIIPYSYKIHKGLA